MIDEKALEASKDAYVLHCLDPIAEDTVRLMIEAYEAALWRPIEEDMKRWGRTEDDEALVFWKGKFFLATKCAVERNALFRTIDPPGDPK